MTTPIGPHFSRLTDYDEDRVQNISRNKRLLPLPYNALELAVHESLKESGGLTFSLRGWFLDDVPKLTPLQEWPKVKEIWSLIILTFHFD